MAHTVIRPRGLRRGESKRSAALARGLRDIQRHVEELRDELSPYMDADAEHPTHAIWDAAYEIGCVFGLNVGDGPPRDPGRGQGRLTGGGGCS